MNNSSTKKKLYLFFIIFFAIELYYFFIDFFISGLFIHYGNSFQGGLIIMGTLYIHSIIFITLILLLYGIMNQRTWTRKFMIFFLFWVSIWAIWGILVGNNVIFHLVLLVIYLILTFYLTTNQVKQYFSKMFRYGKYVLYTQMVTLKSGRQLPIYFFSDHISKSGQLTPLPEGYIVKENEKSHMPYLRKNDQSQPLKKSKGENKKVIRTKIYVIKNHQSDSEESWVIRLNKKTLSSHQTKQLAINKAREIAIEHHAIVMVQNTNGQFSYGFKPKQSSRIK